MSTAVEKLREREAKLVRVIESLDALIGSKEWSSLKTELFDGLVETLERQIRAEATKPDISVNALYVLQGELKWARRYSKLEELRATYHTELLNTRKQLSNGLVEP